MAAREPKPQRMAFVKCLMYGFHTELKKAATADERQRCKNRLAQKLHDEEGTDLVICTDTLDLLEAVLFGTVMETPQPERLPVPELQSMSAGVAVSVQKNELDPLVNVILTDFDDSMKIATIKAVREITGFGLKEAKELVENTPSLVIKGVSTTEAIRIKGILNASGGTVETVKYDAALHGPLFLTTPSDYFVKIQGGTFMMGSPVSEYKRKKDETQHQVTVSNFYMGKYEVTQWEYEDVMKLPPPARVLLDGVNPNPKLSVVLVFWFTAIEYCNKRSEKEGLIPAYTIDKTQQDPNDKNPSWWVKLSTLPRWITWDQNSNGYRLPTEAEWEYACRAGTTGPFNTGDNISTDQANYNGHYPYNNNVKGINRKKITPVGSFAPNSWGLFDMHGNVCEWCWDWYGSYSNEHQNDPLGALSGKDRVIRGGCCIDHAENIRSASRGFCNDGFAGFRVCRSSL
jgi:ribosomal protein L7/L12